MKKGISITLDSDVYAISIEQARKENRTLSNYVNAKLKSDSILTIDLLYELWKQHSILLDIIKKDGKILTDERIRQMRILSDKINCIINDLYKR